MKKQTLLLALLLYVASATITFATFSMVIKPVIVPDSAPTGGATDDQGTQLGQLLTIDPKEPRNQPCPLNGQLYTQTERTAWEQKRPLAVMIENTPDSRPQSGLSSADIVFEAVAEGGVTRFMGMYLCAVQVADTTLAPIRSARSYFVDWASGFNLPLYTHVGGANLPGPSDALGQISEYGWNGQNDLNQFSIGYPTFVRDYNRIPGKEVATEHTMVTTTEKLWAVAKKRGWTNMSPDRKVGARVTPGTDWKEGYQGWNFEEGKTGTGSVNAISYEFWSGYSDYAVQWQYDPATNTYKRSQGGETHTDLNNNQQITAKNVIVLFTTEKGPINEKKHMLYGTTGTGRILLFKNGEAVEGTWSKKSRTAELQFNDAKGQPLALNAGQVWISVVGSTNEVEY